MSTLFGAEEAADLARIVIQQFPVFVLGPGCHRVGFDDPSSTGWIETRDNVVDLLAAITTDVESQNFLAEFYLSKVSEERRAEARENALRPLFRQAGDRAVERQRHISNQIAEEPDDDQRSFSPWRTALAVEILSAYRHASRCLGLVIARGTSPVLEWEKASVSADVAHAVEDGAAAELSKLTTALETARAIARCLETTRLQRAPSLADRTALADLEYPSAAVLSRIGTPDDDVFDENWRSSLAILQPGRIVACLTTLLGMGAGKLSEPLRGGNVEWLGALLWHILSSDTALQPSQADLAFYVTLNDVTWTPALRRARYGDRASTSDSIARLADHKGAEAPRSTAHGHLMSTIARGMWAQYAVVEAASELSADQKTRPREQGRPAYRDDEKWAERPNDTVVLALASDYGDQLESALLRPMRRNDTLHVVLPLWIKVDGQPAVLDWVLGSATKVGNAVSVSPWQWLNQATSISGPIIVKLQGSTKLPFGANFDALEATLPDRDDVGGYRIELALLYDEHDRLTAMRSFERLLSDARRGPLVVRLATLDKGLPWKGRSVLVFGQQFADWVPRFRLFSQRWSGEIEASPRARRHRVSHWAIDRDFDLPEAALLEALGIKMVQGDLETVSRALVAEVARIGDADEVTHIFVRSFADRGGR